MGVLKELSNFEGHVTCVLRNLEINVFLENDLGRRFCRFHLSKPDYDGRYSCCGALHAVNPRGGLV